MSSSHSPEDAAPAPVPAAVKSQRVLACVLCQQRKVKCDRKFPPAGEGGASRSAISLARLRYYEELLSSNKIKFDPLHGPSAAAHDDDDKDSPQGSYESGDEQTEAVATVGSSPPPAASYQAKNQSAHGTFGHEPDVRKRRPPTVRVAEQPQRRRSLDAAPGAHPDLPALAGLSRQCEPPPQGHTHPDPAGTYCRGGEQAGGIDPNLEALMFSIYSMAILSLDDDECESMFGLPKKDLSTKYQFACHQALSNASFLRCNDRDCLTALFLYLLSVRTHTMPSSLSSLLSIAIRIAERMGLDSEAELAKHSVLEAEMRRRLWWSLVIFDHRTREKSHMHATSLVPTWDCKVPLNVNDSDLRPEMKEPPTEEAHGKPTEALFAVVRAEMADFVRNTPSHLEFTMPILKPIAQPLPEGGDVAALHRLIEEKHLKNCDDDNPLQFMAKWTVRSYIAKNRLLAYYAQFSNPPGASQPLPPTEAQRAAALSYALAMLQCDEKMMGSPLTKGFGWFNSDVFPFPAYVFVVQEIKRRPLARHAQQAWRVMSDSYLARFQPVDPQFVPMFKIFGNFILRAWDAFEAARRRAMMTTKGEGTSSEDAPPDMTPPPLVPMIREMLAEMAREEAQKTRDAANSTATSISTPDLTSNFIMAMPMSGFGPNPNLAYTFDRVMQDNSTTYEETNPDPLLFSNSVPVDLDFNNQAYWNTFEWGTERGW
ncbi:hypothetical protein PG997_006709 [Apiospora hydei]|uniref:Xylanolytic transcriptional activator regulatory domain-containing protein n=1 Tax=Apiospora hydei TaxID=1337664 RepID=A0ABR1WPJ3_9PEZI